SNNDITELAGVETFNNGGSVKSGTIDLQDGFTGDVFTLSPTSGGTLAFNGEAGNSFLKVDSFLGTPSDSSSDTLVINGNVAGSTGIQVNNVNAGFGGYNPTGIDVVNATGSLSPENFYLAGGPDRHRPLQLQSLSQRRQRMGSRQFAEPDVLRTAEPDLGRTIDVAQRCGHLARSYG